jgi:hypothetical protein
VSRNRKITFDPIAEEALSVVAAPEAYQALEGEMFRLDAPDDGAAEAVVRPSTTYWHDVWQRFRKDPLALFGLFVIVLMSVACIFVPMFSSYTYSGMDLGNMNASPAGFTCVAPTRWGGISLSASCTARGSPSPSASSPPRSTS